MSFDFVQVPISSPRTAQTFHRGEGVIVVGVQYSEGQSIQRKDISQQATYKIHAIGIAVSYPI